MKINDDCMHSKISITKFLWRFKMNVVKIVLFLLNSI